MPESLMIIIIIVINEVIIHHVHLKKGFKFGDSKNSNSSTCSSMLNAQYESPTENEPFEIYSTVWIMTKTI